MNRRNSHSRLEIEKTTLADHCLEPRPIRLEIGSDSILKHQISNIAESPPANLSAMNIKVDIKIPEEASFVISRTKKSVKVKYPVGEKCIPIKVASRSDLNVIVIMILYEVRASKKRREWLDAICRLIIWTTLSSQTSIPRDPLTTISYYNTRTQIHKYTQIQMYTYITPGAPQTFDNNIRLQYTNY